MFANSTSIIRPVATMAAAIFTSTLCLAAAIPAKAAETQSIQVRVSDLDLGSKAGRDQLNARVHRAADVLCHVQGAADLATVTADYKCVRDVMARVQPQLLALTAPAANQS